MELYGLWINGHPGALVGDGRHPEWILLHHEHA
jgi:hypothetical protein